MLLMAINNPVVINAYMLLNLLHSIHLYDKFSTFVSILLRRINFE